MGRQTDKSAWPARLAPGAMCSQPSAHPPHRRRLWEAQWPCCQVPAWDTAPARAAWDIRLTVCGGLDGVSTSGRHHCHPHGWGGPRPRGWCLLAFLQFLLHAATQGQDAWCSSRIQLACVLGAGLGAEGRARVTRPLGETPLSQMKPPGQGLEWGA